MEGELLARAPLRLTCVRGPPGSRAIQQTGAPLWAPCQRMQKKGVRSVVARPDTCRPDTSQAPTPKGPAGTASRRQARRLQVGAAGEARLGCAQHCQYVNKKATAHKRARNFQSGVADKCGIRLGGAARRPLRRPPPGGEHLRMLAASTHNDLRMLTSRGGPARCALGAALARQQGCRAGGCQTPPPPGPQAWPARAA